MGVRKHRKVKVHGNVTPSGPTKLAIRRLVATLYEHREPLRARLKWYGSAGDLFRAERGQAVPAARRGTRRSGP